MQKVIITNEEDAKTYDGLVYGLHDIMKELHCSRRTAFRLLRLHAAILVDNRVIHKRYRAVTCWQMEIIKEWWEHGQHRGNPNFKKSRYQSELARRPRRRRLDR